MKTRLTIILIGAAMLAASVHAQTNNIPQPEQTRPGSAALFLRPPSANITPPPVSALTAQQIAARRAAAPVPPIPPMPTNRPALTSSTAMSSTMTASTSSSSPPAFPPPPTNSPPHQNGASSTNQLTPVIQFCNGGALLTWPSVPGIVYDIEAAPYVDVIQYFPMDLGLPAMGTNTFWTDLGYPYVLPNPTNDPARFYKIIGYSNSATPPTITLSVPQGNLSNVVSLSASTLTPSNAPIMGIRLYVDGGLVDMLPQDGNFALDTSLYKNGTHKLYAIAENDFGAESTDTNSFPNTTTHGYGMSAVKDVVFINLTNGVTIPALPVITFGVMYQGNHPEAKDTGPVWQPPFDGIRHYIPLETTTRSVSPPFGPLLSAKDIARGFSWSMLKAEQQLGFVRHDKDFDFSDPIRPLNSPYAMFSGPDSDLFNKVNFGLLIGHQAMGLYPDYTVTAAGALDTYYPIYRSWNVGYDWVGMGQVMFGSDQLNWMAILSCNSLSEPNFDDMVNKFTLPMNEQLHLLLGSSSGVYIVSDFGQVFADALTGHNMTNGPMTIVEAWFYAGTVTQGKAAVAKHHAGVPVKFFIVGWQNCWLDTIYNSQVPDPSYGLGLYTEERQVYP